MAEKSFGVKEINLIGASGTPTIESPNNLNLNAVNVAISTNATIGGNLTVSGTVGIAGTLTYEDVTNIDSIGIVTAREGIFIPDLKELKIGNTSSSPDLKLYHDNNGDSYISNATGHLTIRNNTSGKIINIQPKSGANGIIARYEGAAELYHNGNKKFETTSSGATVTGTLTATTFSGSGASLTNLPAANITGTLSSSVGFGTAIAAVWHVGHTGASNYNITGPGNLNNAVNPDLYLERNKVYQFNMNASGHGFGIQTSSGTWNSSNEYTTGITNARASTGIIRFSVPNNAPSTLYYACTSSHSGMVGTIYIYGGSSTVTVSSNSNNRVITGGSGSNLVGEPRLTFDGNSLDISGSGSHPFSVSGGDFRNLVISGNSASSSGFIYLGNGAATNNADFDLGRIRIYNGATQVAQISGSTDTSANDDGRIVFATRNTGGSLQERLRIDSSGQVKVTETTNTSSTTTGAFVVSGGIGVAKDVFVGGDLDVDAHTNLDNVSIAGITTITKGLVMTAGASNLYQINGALSYYAADNAVYLNGAGDSGVLRLNATGTYNDRTSINIHGKDVSNYQDAITFKTVSQERLRIDNSGRMGLGVTPTGIFDIREDNNPQLTLRANSHADNAGGRVNFGVGVAFAPQDGNTVCSIASTIHSTSGGTLKGDLKFYTNGGDDLEERFIISSEGNVSIEGGNLTFSSNNHKILTSSSGHMITIQGGASNPGGRIELRGGNSSGDIRMFAQGATSTAAERLRIKSDGKILGGNHLNDRGAILQIESSDHAMMGIHRNVNSHGAPAFVFSSSRGTSAGSNTIVQNGDYLGMINFKGTDGVNLASGAYITARVDGTPGENDMPGRLDFWTSPDDSQTPVERLRIDSSGFVSIGREGSAEAFNHASNGVTNTMLEVKASDASNSIFETATFRGGAGNNGAGARVRLVHSGDRGLVLTGGRISNAAFGSISLSDQNGDVITSVHINSSGTWFWGKTSQSSGTPGVELYKDGPNFMTRAANGGSVLGLNDSNGTSGTIMRFYYQDSLKGSLNFNGSTFSTQTHSDYRLKENDTPISDGIARVKQLRPIKFNWKNDSSTTYDGFFAHEVQTVVPAAVTGEKDAEVNAKGEGYQAMSQEGLIPLLTAALKEEIAKREALEARIDALESS